MSPKAKRAASLAPLLLAALALSGCSSSTEAASREGCTDEAVLAKHRTDAGAVDAVEATIDTVAGDGAYTIDGITEVTYADGDSTSYEWTCFSQTADGTTHAAILEFERAEE